MNTSRRQAPAPSTYPSALSALSPRDSVVWVAFALVLTTVATFQHVGGDFVVWFSDPVPGMWARLARYWSGFLVSISTMLVILKTTERRLSDRRAWRWATLSAAVVVAAGIGCLIERILLVPGWFFRPWAHTLVVVAILVALLIEFRWGYRQSQAALHRVELDRLRLQSEVTAARLQLLQASIEPHFIFNALANIRRLLRVDPVVGRTMLGDFLRYFEHALPRLRDDAPTLGREIESARAFLAIHQIRMGARLRVEISVPEELLERIVPSMMLLTLIENALKHGIYPRAEGGTLCVQATGSLRGPLTLRVSDDGCGLREGFGHGMGLANIRARLSAMYGNQANFSLSVNFPSGVVATLLLPAVPA